MVDIVKTLTFLLTICLKSHHQVLICTSGPGGSLLREGDGGLTLLGPIFELSVHSRSHFSNVLSPLGPI